MTFSRTFSAVVFDNDGTLVNSRPGLFRAWVAWANEHEVPPEELLGLDGRSSEDIVRLLVGEERAPAAHERSEHLEVTEAHDTTAHPGVLDALDLLPADRVAIATSGTWPVATARLEAAGIDLPSVVVTVDDVKNAKPDPDIFLLACERLGFPPEECLVVEDAPFGVEAGKAAGCTVLAVATTVDREKLTHADVVVGSLDEVRFAVTDAGLIHVEV